LQFHHILRLATSFRTSLILSHHSNAPLIKDNPRFTILQALGRLFASIFPILIISPNDEATIMEEIMNVITIMVIVILLENAREASV